MGSRVTPVMGFLSANFQLAVPFLSGLRIRYGTDGQTDNSINALCVRPMGAGHNKNELVSFGHWWNWLHSTLPSVDRFTYSADKYNILVSRVINCFMLCALIPGQYWYHRVPFNSPKLFTVDCGVVNLRWLRFAVSVASFAGRYQVYTERQRNRMDSGHLSSSATFTGDTC